MSDAGKATFSGNVIVSGDLTVSGDDITMGTNTAGNLLVADGTNFNSIAAGSLSEISTVASDDVFIAVDTSGGGLKKITRSTIVAGLATSGAISNLVEDTSPQLGGDLDTNSANILIDDAHFIADENGNEQIIFQTTSSAVNQFDITNAATSGAPKLSATGGDSNIDLEIEAKGTGHVTVRGNTNAGAIQFNCESNSHGQILKSQPHSAAVTNVMLLPDGADSTLVSLVATQTLTNKTLTSPVINSPTGDFIKIGGTSFANSIIVGHASTGTLNDANRNVAVGIESLDAVTSGDDNTVVGYGAGTSLTTGSTNTAIGNISMKYGTSGGKNSSLGYQALLNANGDGNIGLGYQSGNNITSGSGNVVIGNADVSSATGDDQLSISDGEDGSVVWITGDSSGNLVFPADVTLGDDLHLDSDAAVLKFGDDGEITITHDADVGLKLKHTATADDKPIVLTLQTGETDMAANDVMGAIRFQAPDEGTGTDAILVAAAIQAVSEGDFSSSSNATKLEFHTGASEAASSKMTLSSAGLLTVTDDIVFKDGGTIGVTSATDAMTVSSAGIVTFKDDILIKDGGTIGVASDADSITIASNGAVTFSQTPVFPDGSLALADLDIDGGTDIGADLVDADLFIVDDGAGGTNRKVAASRIKTYVGGGTSWQAVKTGNFTATAGQGVFCNTTSAAFTLTLPAGSIGDEVSFIDYARTFDTNNLTIAANGSEKIHGSTDDLTIATEGAANTLVFTDSTQGWLLKSK